MMPLVFAGRLLGMFHTLYLNFASFCFYDKSWIFDMVIYNYIPTVNSSFCNISLSSDLRLRQWGVMLE
jgi:hypothetical protein